METTRVRTQKLVKQCHWQNYNLFVETYGEHSNEWTGNYLSKTMKHTYICGLNHRLRSSSRARTINPSTYICSHEIRTSNDPTFHTRCENKLSWIWLLMESSLSDFPTWKELENAPMGVGEFSKETLWANVLLNIWTPSAHGRVGRNSSVLTMMHWWIAHQLKWVVFSRKRSWCSGIWVWTGLDTLCFL